ncbi:hypothetical protein B0H15DRAFT_482465 [Mycena belliarum]|uniref:Uncharacterized protein n=1 Tax=Mycena belliarum TaxID=1033014 RepID=A0AAD6XQD7_9AGAR|nr:hypothetical protein B0H15DRAFT_482465 [Mycena belliae]
MLHGCARGASRVRARTRAAGGPDAARVPARVPTAPRVLAVERRDARNVARRGRWLRGPRMRAMRKPLTAPRKSQRRRAFSLSGASAWTRGDRSPPQPRLRCPPRPAYASPAAVRVPAADPARAIAAGCVAGYGYNDALAAPAAVFEPARPYSRSLVSRRSGAGTLSPLATPSSPRPVRARAPRTPPPPQIPPERMSQPARLPTPPITSVHERWRRLRPASSAELGPRADAPTLRLRRTQVSAPPRRDARIAFRHGHGSRGTVRGCVRSASREVRRRRESQGRRAFHYPARAGTRRSQPAARPVQRTQVAFPPLIPFAPGCVAGYGHDDALTAPARRPTSPCARPARLAPRAAHVSIVPPPSIPTRRRKCASPARALRPPTPTPRPSSRARALVSPPQTIESGARAPTNVCARALVPPPQAARGRHACSIRRRRRRHVLQIARPPARPASPNSHAVNPAPSRPNSTLAPPAPTLQPDACANRRRRAFRDARSAHSAVACEARPGDARRLRAYPRASPCGAAHFRRRARFAPAPGRANRIPPWPRVERMRDRRGTLGAERYPAVEAPFSCTTRSTGER